MCVNQIIADEILAVLNNCGYEEHQYRISLSRLITRESFDLPLLKNL
jgi:hypothetical protein